MDDKILDVAHWLIDQAQAFGAGAAELKIYVDGYQIHIIATKNNGDNQSRDDA